MANGQQPKANSEKPEVRGKNQETRWGSDEAMSGRKRETVNGRMEDCEMMRYDRTCFLIFHF